MPKYFLVLSSIVISAFICYNIIKEDDMRNLFRFLTFWINIGTKYQILKESPSRERSTSLGVTSILMSIFGVLTAVGFTYLALLCFKTEGLTVLVAVPGGIICLLAAVMCFIQLLIASIFYAGYQMRLNKRPIGIVALVLSLLFIVLAIVGVFIVITSL